MVAPHQVGDLVRSFVRVPGCGSKKSAKASFCDLGRTSTHAATVLIPQNLPRATNVLTQTPAASQYPSNQHPFTAAIHNPSAKVQKLKEENEKLRKEKEILKKQLSLFKHIIQCYESQQKKGKSKKKWQH